MTAEHCSFCGQTRGSVRFLLAGPAAAICGECVALAVRQMVDGVGLLDAEAFDNAPILEVSKFVVDGPGSVSTVPAALSSGEAAVIEKDKG